MLHVQNCVRLMASILWALLLFLVQLPALATSRAHDDGNLTLWCHPDQAAALLQLKLYFFSQNPPPSSFLHGKMAPIAVSGTVSGGMLLLVLSQYSISMGMAYTVMAWTLHSSALNPFSTSILVGTL